LAANRNNEPLATDAAAEVEEVVEPKRRYPFTAARLFSYTRMLEARIVELEEALVEKEAFVTHLANMGLAMRGIPPPKQQQRRQQSSKVTAKPRTMAQIHLQNQARFEQMRQEAQASSGREQERVVRSEQERAEDAQDVQEQINAVVANRNR
jgi:hypothetical protein